MPFLRFLFENRLFLLAGVLLSFTSSYGQTYFISIFAGELQAAFDLSHGAWGGIYAVGTMASAAVMLWAGALTDRFRVRVLAMAVMALLILACLAMAMVPGPVALVGVVFLLRFAGQGMMSQLSIVAMARWFVASRGKALSVASMGYALGQAALPVIFVAALPVTGWRLQWVIAAGLVLITMPVVLRLLAAERSPQSLAEDKASLGMGGRHWTRGDMVRHPLFWCLLPLLLGPPAWGTALFFHQVHLTEAKGWALVDYVSLFPLFVSVTIASTFASGWAIDRFGSATLLRGYLLPFALTFLVIGTSTTLAGAALGLAIYGIAAGLQATVIGAFWAELYGTRHVGSIKAVSTAAMVLGSALGPGISGWLIDLGYPFSDQMIVYSVYFVGAGLITAAALALFARPSATTS